MGKKQQAKRIQLDPRYEPKLTDDEINKINADNLADEADNKLRRDEKSTVYTPLIKHKLSLSNIFSRRNKIKTEQNIPTETNLAHTDTIGNGSVKRFSFFGGRKAKKDAKKAEKESRKQNNSTQKDGNFQSLDPDYTPK